MRQMQLPAEDDDDILSNFIGRAATNAALALMPILVDVLDRYNLYRSRRGNPWDVPIDPAFAATASSFHEVYAREPAGFEFIDILRKSLHGTCPMCGATGNGSLDHYLPKKDYPEFSFLSVNLIPCCTKCNPLRGTAFKGALRDARALHAYYDQLAGLTLVTLSINPPFDTPGFRASVTVAAGHVLHDAASWHLTHVVLRAGFLVYCEKRWARLIEVPLTLCGRTPTVEGVRVKLLDRAGQAYATDGSVNGWEVVFLLGVCRSDEALAYLAAHLATRLSDVNYSENTGLERALLAP